MIINPIISIVLAVLLLVLSVYLATWPRRSGLARNLPGDMSFDAGNEPGPAEPAQHLALRQEKRSLCV